MPTETILATSNTNVREPRSLGALATLVAATGLLIVAAMAPASAQTAVVEGAEGNVWEPDTLEIAAGTVVTFEMTGGDAGHNGALEGEEVVPFTPIGQSAEYTFEEEGEFDFVCTLHPGMEMVVTVSGDGADLADDAPEDDAAEDEAPADDDAADDEAPEDDAAEDDAAEDDAAEDDTAEDDTAEDEELVAADVDADEGGDTVLLLAVLVALALMIGSFSLIRRHSD